MKLLDHFLNYGRATPHKPDTYVGRLERYVAVWFAGGTFLGVAGFLAHAAGYPIVPDAVFSFYIHALVIGFAYGFAFGVVTSPLAALTDLRRTISVLLLLHGAALAAMPFVLRAVIEPAIAWTAAFLLLIASGMSSPVWAPRSQKRNGAPSSRCDNCGYDLSGLENEVACPECAALLIGRNEEL